MASIIQPNLLPTRDTRNACDTPPHARSMDSAHASGLRGSAWSSIPNIWQVAPQGHAKHNSGTNAPVSPTRSDSLTAPKFPHDDPPIPGSAGVSTGNRAYPLRNPNSSTVPIQSSVGRGSHTIESSPRQRGAGLRSAHTNSKMPLLSTATLLSGSGPDVDLHLRSAFSSLRNGENRLQTINVGGIDEFVPASQQHSHRSRPSESRFGYEWAPAYDQLGTAFNTTNHSFVPARQSNHGIFEQQNTGQLGARLHGSNIPAAFEETWNHPNNQESFAGFPAQTNAQTNAHSQSLSAALTNLHLNDTQRHRPHHSFSDTQGHPRQQQHPQREDFLDNNSAPGGSTDTFDSKDVEYSTPQLTYQNTIHNGSPFHGGKGGAALGGMVMYTPSYTPPSSQSVDTRLGYFDTGSTFFTGRQSGFPVQHNPVGNELHSHAPHAFNPVFTVPQTRMVRSYEAPNRHPSSSEARIQQEKEQNLSPLIKDFRANYKTKRYKLKDAYNHIVEFSGDQLGIQAKLETANSEEKEKVFAEIQEKALQLMTDIFGNYVIQKMFEHGTQAQKKILANQMKGRVFYLTTQVYGCRVVQKALEHVLTDQQASMVKELEGNVLSIVENQNGNHVIQKAIERVPSEHIQFIFDAHVGHVVRLSKHNYGCRVVQRMLEYATLPVKRVVLGELREAIPILIEDQFGNYVVQHIIRNGERPDRRVVVTLILQQLLHFSKHKFASNVVEAAIECAEPQQRQEILRKLTSETDSQGQSQVYGLIRDQYGNYVIQKVLAMLQGAALNDLIVEIQHHLVSLRKISHGKQVSAMEKALADAIVTLGPQYIGHRSKPHNASTEISPRSPTFSGGFQRYHDHPHSSRMV